MDWDAIEYFNLILFYFKKVFLCFYFRFLFISLDDKSAISPGTVENYMGTSISPY